MTIQMMRKHPLLIIGCATVLLAVAVLLQRDSVPDQTANASASLPVLTANISPEIQKPHDARRSAQVTRSTFAVLNHDDILPRHKTLLEETLRSLPSGCRSTLKRLYVRYDDSVSRALGGTETIVLNGNIEDDELRALFIHEFGHITDLGCITGSSSVASGFRDGATVIPEDDPSVSFYRISWTAEKVQLRGARSADFVSGYASWDAFEDFAETYAYYMLQREAFVHRAKSNDAIAKKLAWMDEHIDAQATTAGRAWNGKVPWDVTKIAYGWNQ